MTAGRRGPEYCRNVCIAIGETCCTVCPTRLRLLLSGRTLTLYTNRHG